MVTKTPTPAKILANGVEASFAPETVFAPGGNLVSNYFRLGTVVADLSHGYNGGTHEGFLRGTIFGVPANCNGCPLPQHVIDPTAPNFATGAAPAPIHVPPAAAPPAGALVFDSFARPNATYTFGGHGGLGSTEGGSAGVQMWQANNAPKTAQPFGILNARAVLLGNSMALAWVPTGSATGNVDVRVDRRIGRWGSGHAHGFVLPRRRCGKLFLCIHDRNGRARQSESGARWLLPEWTKDGPHSRQKHCRQIGLTSKL